MAQFDYTASEYGAEPPAESPFIDIGKDPEEEEEEEEEIVAAPLVPMKDDLHVPLKSEKMYVIIILARNFCINFSCRDGYGLFKDVRTTEFSVSGITCSSCVNLIQTVVKGVPGICNVRF